MFPQYIPKLFTEQLKFHGDKIDWTSSNNSSKLYFNEGNLFRPLGT